MKARRQDGVVATIGSADVRSVPLGDRRDTGLLIAMIGNAVLLTMLGCHCCARLCSGDLAGVPARAEKTLKTRT